MDVKVCKYTEGRVSDHYLPEAKMRFMRKWYVSMKRGKERSVVKVGELNRKGCESDYEHKLKHRWKRVCKEMVRNVEENGNIFEKVLLEVAVGDV